DHPCAFVAEHRRERREERAVAHGEVRVAHAGRAEPYLDLIRLRRLELEVDDLEWRVDRVADGGSRHRTLPGSCENARLTGRSTVPLPPRFALLALRGANAVSQDDRDGQDHDAGDER